MMLFNAVLPEFFIKPSAPVLDGERIQLRIPQKKDWINWHYVREHSRSFLSPWEPGWTEDRLSEEYYYSTLLRNYKKQRRGEGSYFFIILKETNSLIGGINIIHIARGMMQSAFLGYWIGEGYHNNGFMTEAVDLILPYAFEHMGLHRIQAACMPDNLPSCKVLKKTGFREEGIARKLVKINNRWQDHIIYALTQEEWSVGSRRTIPAGQFLRIDT